MNMISIWMKVSLAKLSQSALLRHSILASIVLIAVAAALSYWLYSQWYISTDDAYVNANVVQMAARVTGQVSKLYVINNQFVHEGDLLMELDAEPFITAVNQAKAQLAINSVNQKNAQVTANRILALVKRHDLSAQAGDDALAKLESANAAVDLANAELAQAGLNLKYTRIIAPTTGWVTNLSLRAGNSITANQPLFALISNEEFWIDANYKETELEHIHAGQTAKITVDMYPNHTFKGLVESISGGSGTAFSLLPPQNATGNWVKVTQRVPVRIRVIDTSSAYPLRIGTTATVTVHIH